MRVWDFDLCLRPDIVLVEKTPDGISHTSFGKRMITETIPCVLRPDGMEADFIIFPKI